MAKEKITGAEAMMRSLEYQGVKTLFGYPGGSIMPTFDALYHHKDTLNHILVRHEQGAAHAAQGFARVSGEVGVCLVTSGPGATNTITGIAELKSLDTIAQTDDSYKIFWILIQHALFAPQYPNWAGK